MGFENRKENHTEIPESKIVLPENPERIARLKAKLQEYKERIEKKGGKDSRLSARVEVLKELLEKGSVDPAEMIAKAGGDVIYQANLEDAIEIVQDYVKTGGQNLHGGTGLPNLEK